MRYGFRSPFGLNHRDERGPWYLLTGLLIGIGLGLFYAWAVQPVQYFKTSPASLRPEFKEQYRALIALAYTANGDIVRARARLGLLKDNDVFRSLAEQAQRTLSEQRSPDEARALGLLAVALGQEAPGPVVVITLPPPTATQTPTVQITVTASASPSFTSTSTETPVSAAMPSSTPLPATQDTLSPTPTITPTATRTSRFTSTPTKTQIPRPTSTPTLTRTPTPTPGGPFALSSREKICTQELEAPLIQIEASNAFGDPMPGILALVTWPTVDGAVGEMRFYTGLKPELGLGYADFTMTPGISYTIQLGDNGETVTGLTAVSCPRTGGGSFWGAWLLKFVQP